MRRFISTENEELDELELPEGYDLEISQEEADLVEAEAMSDAEEINSETAEAERMLDIADSLEDMAVVVDGIDEATPAETQLIQVAGDMATAGENDVTSEDIMPATEGYIGRRISSEGFKDRAKEIYENFKKWLARIWNSISGFFAKIFKTSSRLKKSMESLKEKIVKMKGSATLKKDGNKFKINSGIKGIMVGIKPAANGKELEDGIKNTVAAMDNIFAKHAGATGKILVSTLSKIDLKGSRSAVDLSVETALQLSRDALTTSLNGKMLSAHRFGEVNAFAVDDIMAQGRAIIYTTPEKWMDKNVTERLDSILKMDARFDTIAEEIPTVKEVEFTTMGLDQMISCLEQAIKLMTQVFQFEIKGKKEMLSYKDKILSETKKLVPESDESTADNIHAAALSKSLLRMNSLYVRLVANLSIEAVKVSIGAARGTVFLVRQSLAQYETSEASK